MDIAEATLSTGEASRLVYRQNAWTRATHWVWAICLFFLLLTGLQIFNAHPSLYFGKQSGFGFDNTVLKINAEVVDNRPIGYVDVLGARIETTGVLGLQTENGRLVAKAFPDWATIPAYHDLATGRVVHFFFAWLLVGTMLTWYAASLINGHLRRDVVPTGRDLKNIGRDIADHARLRFHHIREYNVLQKFAYAGVLLVLFPLIVITGLIMSPAMDSFAPWLVDLFGGRQTARTIHFGVMVLLVLFFVVHILMIIAAGPINELRSIITGWYRTDPVKSEEPRA